MNSIFIKIATLLAIGGALSAPGESHACKCAPPPSAKVAMTRSTAVFVGYVADMVTTGPGTEKLTEHERMVVLKVRRRWKGEDIQEERVATRKVAPACGYPFKKGEVYIVFAEGGPERRRTDRCSNTAPYSEKLARKLDKLEAASR